MKRRELPDSYRWVDRPDEAILYLRWGWAATVRPHQVEVKGTGGRRLGGRCGSIEQGKRFVERWTLGHWGSTYGRWKARWEAPKPFVPTRAELAIASDLANRRVLPVPESVSPPDGLLDGEWETWVWRQGPLERLRAFLSHD